MRKFTLVIILLLQLALTGCSGAGASNQGSKQEIVSMSNSGFTGATSITIHDGDSIKFSFTSGNDMYFLTTGFDGLYVAEDGAPANLSQPAGEMVMRGAAPQSTFTTPGTYHITCLMQSGMNITIQVL